MSIDENTVLNLSEIGNVTDEQSKVIQNILQRTNPIECEILGKKTIEQIAKGKKFDAVEGGRHMSFVEAISVLSGIATVAQLVLFVIGNMKKPSENGDGEVENDEQTKNEAKEIVLDAISMRPELKKLEKVTEQDNTILDKILDETIKSRKTGLS